MNNQENTIDLSEFAVIIRKRINFIILIVIICVTLSAIISFFLMTPVYQAKTSIIIGSSKASENSQTQYSDVMMYQNLMKTYQGIANSKLVAQKTIDKLDGKFTEEQLASMVTVTSQTDTQILDITIKNIDPKTAEKIADVFSNVFIEQSKVVFPTGGSIQIMDNAVLQKDPVSPNKKFNIIIGFIAGVFISIGFVFTLEYMDNTIKTEKDVEKYLELPIIGIIPNMNYEQ